MPRGMANFLTDEEKNNRPKITKALVKRAASYLTPYWKQVLVVLISIVAVAILEVFPAVLTGRIIDEGLIGKNLDILVKLIVISLGVILLSSVISVLQSYINTWIAQHISFDMRNKMFRHLQSMSHRFFTSNKQGDIITRMTSDISGVETVITNTLSTILSNIITLAVALFTMYKMNWILATIGIIIVPLFSIPTKTVGKKRWTLTRKAQDLNDEVNTILDETMSVSGQLLVKLFTNENHEYQRYKKANKSMIKLKIVENLTGRWFRVVLNTFTSIGPMLIYLAGGVIIMQYDSGLTVGDISVMVVLLGKMYRPVNSLLGLQVDVIRSMALFTRIFGYLDMPVEIENAKEAVMPEKFKGAVSFENVSFYYDKNKSILNNVSFSLEPGKTLAIVGPSGAGKSTIINLIPRLYDVTDGRILIDGHDVRSLDLGFLRKKIGMVSQDTYLFNDTIRANLLYADFNATEDDLIQACKKANIHDFITAQHNGYDTVVGNRGLKLSGGEKQRLSIARAILKDPDILIFDEATSSLDSISENLIQDAIDPLISERTSIVIAHRLSTIMSSDEIIVINGGEIIERGTHSDLVQNSGIYTELYETQFRRALDEYDVRKGVNV